MAKAARGSNGLRINDESEAFTRRAMVEST